MASYFVVDENDTIVNCAEWDGVTPWDLPKGLRAVLGDGMWGDGWKWDGAKSYDPNPPPSAPPVVIEQMNPLQLLNLGLNKL